MHKYSRKQNKKSKITIITIHVYVTVNNTPPSTLHASTNQLHGLAIAPSFFFPRMERKQKKTAKTP